MKFVAEPTSLAGIQLAYEGKPILKSADIPDFIFFIEKMTLKLPLMNFS